MYLTSITQKAEELIDAFSNARMLVFCGHALLLAGPTLLLAGPSCIALFALKQ